MNNDAFFGEASMIQLILHLWGDYLTQSDWMAQNKTKRWIPALVHATVYSLPFFLIGSWQAVLVIFLTHAYIDRYRMARYICWAKNFISPRWIRASGHHHTCRCWECEKWIRNYPWTECTSTGYHKDSPAWLSTWLLIIADNTLHLTINFLCLKYL
jgi:hypothetical protein